MPTGDEYALDAPIKMMLIGDSSSGKTGALASLLDAGWKLRLVDFDNGLEPLIQYTKDKSKLKNLEYETFTDKLKPSGSLMVPDGQPTAIQRGLKQLTDWTAEPTPGTIVIVDSFTFLCKAAFRYVRYINGRSAIDPYQSDYGLAQDIAEGALAKLFATETTQHTIVLAHIKYFEDENMPTRGLPMAIGKALSPNVGSYFNTVFGVRTKGSGTNVRRLIRTRSEGIIELKCPFPDFPLEVPLETGLADFFAAVRPLSSKKSK